MSRVQPAPPPPPPPPTPDVSVTVGGTAELSPAVHVSDEPTNVSVSAAATGYVVLNAKNLAKGKFDLMATLRLLVGGASYRGDEATLLGGVYDRLTYALSRANVVADGPVKVAIPKFNILFKHKPTGLSAFAGVSPQEEYVYPYNFNSTTFSDGTSMPTLRYSLFDNTSWANLYLVKFGYQGGVIFEPPQVEGLRFALEAGPDGGFAGSPSWSVNGQAGYTANYDAGSTAITGFAMGITPAATTNDFGEHVSSRVGGGGFIGQTIAGPAPVTLGVGVSGSTQHTGEITNSAIGANVGASVQLADRVALTGGYTFYGIIEDTSSATERTSENGVEGNVAIRLSPKAPGLGLTAGYAGVFTDADNQVSSTINGDQHFVYLALTYGGAKTFELGK